MEENKKSLYIPVNTPDYDAIISGVGTTEVIIFSVTTILAIIFGLIMAQLTGILFAVLLGISAIGFSILTFKKDIYNENFYMKMRIIQHFNKGQKEYRYEYSNIYEIPLKGEEPQ